MNTLMMKRARWKNILSTGNAFTEIELDRNTNTLIVGSNGAGKSTVLDVICFVLYGKPFRKIRKDQLINSINNADAVGEVEFTSYNTNYRVVRGIKPNIFEIYKDGLLINQDAAVKDYQEYLEKHILRMSMKSFTQIVILGSSFIPFMQLSSNIRREVIEDLLDIRIFSTMSSLLRAKIADNKEAILLNDKDKSSKTALLSVHEDTLKRAQSDSQKSIDEDSERIAELTKDIKYAETEISSIESAVIIWMDAIWDRDKVARDKIDLDRLETKLSSKKKVVEKSMDFYRTSNTCPTCTQDITEKTKAEKLKEKNDIIDKLDEALDELGERQSVIIARGLDIDKIHKLAIAGQQDILTRLIPEIQGHEREVKLLNKRITSTQYTGEDYTKTVIAGLNKELEDTKKLYEEHIVTREIQNLANVILKDSGIKARIIKQYVPVINALVNKYLAAMDFFVKFELNENFEEKILSRHRDDFTYNSFSEGEKMRIDLALLFTWRSIARMKNSASTNMLFLDEVFDASLDTTGCEEFLKMIHDMEDANVFVISHKGDLLEDKFRSTIKFEKVNNFSRMVT